MAELIGVIASVVGLAGAAATVTVTLVECGQTVAHAREELDKLAGEVCDLTVVLEYLGEVLQQQGTRMTAQATETVNRLVQRCQSALDELSLAVALVRSKSTRLSWFFRKSKMQQHKLNLGGFRSNLSLMIQTLTLAKALENESKTSNASVTRNISQTTQRNWDLLRSAVLTNRSVFNQLKVMSDREVKKSEPAPSEEPSLEQESRQDIFWHDPSSTWDQVLLKSLAELDKNATVSETLATTIPKPILTARKEKKSTSQKKQPNTESGTLDSDVDGEIKVLLSEWTKTSSANVELQFEKQRQQKRSAMPGVPQWIQDQYDFVGTDTENPQHWKPKSNKAGEEVKSLPYSRSAYEPAEENQTPMFDIFAQEGGAWVWRHDDGFTRDYYVNDKMVMQYFVKPPPPQEYGVGAQEPLTIVGKQWISKHVLQSSNHVFREYGEGSWAISGKLSTEAVKELHEASSRRQEYLLQLLSAQASQPKPSAPQQRKGRAMFTFDVSEPDDLPFKKGDVLTIHGNTDNKFTWWKASLNGRTGQIPSNRVSLL